MDISSGWSDTEVAAMQKQQMVDRGKREELNLILKAISMVPERILPLDSPIRQVHSMDVDFRYLRKRNLDISTRANALSTLLSHGIDGRHALIAADIFPDVEQVWVDSKDGIEAYQKATYLNSANGETESRNTQDLSDQLTNSPILREENT